MKTVVFVLSGHVVAVPPIGLRWRKLMSLSVWGQATSLGILAIYI